MTEIPIPTPELVNIEQLSVDSQNPNRMTPKQHAALADSIRRYGFIVPIITNKDLLIADGEQRWIVAQALGMDQVPVIRLPVEDVDRRLLRQVLNKLRGEHELIADAYEFERIIQMGHEDDLKSLLLLTDSQIERYLLEIKETKEEIYVIPEIEKITTTIQRGDIYNLGDHRLMCGDATDETDIETLMNGWRGNMVYVDPPYGLGHQIVGDTEDIACDPSWNEAWLRNLFASMAPDTYLIISHATSKFLPCLNKAIEVGFHFHRMNTLYKRNQEMSYPWQAWLIKTEAVLILTKGNAHAEKVSPYQHDTYLMDYGKFNRSLPSEYTGGCPTAKVIEFVVDYIRRCSPPRSRVMDVFGGSGTTLIACEQLGRICYMMEIDPRYCQVIINRWEAYTGGKAQKLVKSSSNKPVTESNPP